MSDPLPEAIIAAIETFVSRTEAARLTAFARSPRAQVRAKARAPFGYNVTFRPDRAREFRDMRDAQDEICHLAKLRHLPLDCVVLSSLEEVDGRRMPFDELFDVIEPWGVLADTFAVLDPNSLAFYQGEATGAATVLFKD